MTVLLLAALSPAFMAGAQTGQGRRYQTPEQRATHRTERMVQALDLSSEQSKAIQAIHLREAKEMQLPLNDIRARRESLVLIHEKYEQEYARVLTPQQMEHFRQLKERSAVRMKEQYEKQERSILKEERAGLH